MIASPAVASDILAAELPQQPYPGLRPFEMSEWSIFFGREPMIDEIIDLMGRQRVVVVHGSSGAGKSSLIRAGVLPRLARQHLRRRVPWLTCAIRPSGGPLWNLATALGELETGKPDMEASEVIRREFDRPNARLADIVGSRPALSGKRICILIDQFEEIFRYAKETSRDEVELLIELLRGVVDEEEPDPSLYMLVTMRSEFLGECARLPGLAQAINRAQYLLPPMDHASLMRAIRRPAELFDAEVEEALAERLITDGRREQDELPLIQHALMLMWQSAAQRVASPHGDKSGSTDSTLEHDEALRLRLDQYVGEGGLAIMLSNHADRLMRAVIPESDAQQNRVIEFLFRALTDINAEGHAIRNPQSFRNLCAITGGDDAAIRAILDAFRAEGVSFVTPYAPAPIELGTIIDISHEALIRSWIRIADPKTGWLQTEFRDGLDWRILRARSNEGSVISAAAIPDREKWLQNRNPAWSERHGGGWTDVKRLMEESRASRARSRRSRWNLVGAGAVVALISIGTLTWYSLQLSQLAKERAEALAVAAQAKTNAEAAASQATDRALTAEAVNLWHPLSFVAGISEETRLGLLALASADADLRGRFIDEMLARPSLALRFSQTRTITRALIGLSAIRRNLVIQRLVKKELPADADPSVVAAFARTAFGAQAVELAPRMIALIQGTADSDALNALGQGMTEFAAQLTPDQSVQAAARVGEAIQRTTDLEALNALVEALAALSGQLTSDQAAQTMARIIDAILGLKRPEAAPVDGLAALATTLTPDQAAQAAAQMSDALLRTTDANAERALSEGFAALSAKFTTDQVAQSVARVSAAMERKTDPRQLGLLAILLGAPAANLTPDQAAQTLARVIDAIQGLEGPAFELHALVEGLAALAVTLTPGLAAQARAHFTDAIQRTTHSEALSVLVQWLAALPGELTPDEIVQAEARVGDALQRTTEPGARHALGRALVALATKFTPDQAAQSADHDIEAIRQTMDSDALFTLAERLTALAPKLKPDQAAQAAARVIDAIEGTRARDALGDRVQGRPAPPGELTRLRHIEIAVLVRLVRAFAAIAPKLSPDQAEHAAARASDALERTTDPETLGAWVRVLVALPAEFTPYRASRAAARVTDAIERTTLGYFSLRALVRGLAILAPELSPDQAARSAVRFTGAIERTTDFDELDLLVEGLAALAPKLTPDQAAQSAARAIDAFLRTTDRSNARVAPARLRELGKSLAAAFAAGLTPDQTAQAVAHVTGAIRRTTGNDELVVLAEALAAVATNLNSDQAVAVLVFEVLKYPWGRTGPLVRALETRFGPVPTPNLSLWPLIEWGRARFTGVVDFESPPKLPAEIAAAVRRAMTGAH